MKFFHNPNHLHSLVSSIIDTSKKKAQFNYFTRCFTTRVDFESPHTNPPMDSSKLQENTEASYSSSSSSKLVLYSYWQSSCSWRVRFALNLKGLSYDYKPVNLEKGEQFSPEFERLNPLHCVPVLVDGDVVVSDSFAILLYLEEKYPQRPLLPADPRLKALNLQGASIISSSIQPLHMLSKLKYMEEKIGSEESLSWAQLHIGKGFLALEKLLKDFASKFATGNEVYMTDVFLAPQIAIAAARFNINMSTFPSLSRVNETYKGLPEFQASSPERQPDAVHGK
ncbi:PREDICTED: glutathione S-transferase 2-like [Fragaria vesca subsp. vesca]|uniref:glutathione S-transferase 2-like n=1 Tax=Fragaria vesca subsp. vesca TaxID=101020 RepID=UPI0002C2FC2E|nr:PREDICTED: glutathione S-transferase 2-like [Fragaria vesca subsp. vesca]